MRKYVVEVRQWVRQTNPGEEWSRRSMRKIYGSIRLNCACQRNLKRPFYANRARAKSRPNSCGTQALPDSLGVASHPRTKS